MINTLMKNEELLNYANYHCRFLRSRTLELDDSWEHAVLIKDLLRDAQQGMQLLVSNCRGDSEAVTSRDRKTEKYTDWVEVMRLAAFQYERFSQKKKARSEALYATLLEMACIWGKNKLYRDILVPGCGPGRSVLDFARAFPSAHVTGLDYSFLSLILAERIICGTKETNLVRRDTQSGKNISELLTIPGFGLDNAAFLLCDLADSALPKCDMVVCSNTLNLLPDHKRAVGHLCDALRPGGLLIFADLIGWRLDRDPSRKLLHSDIMISSAFESCGMKMLDSFSGVPYIESESADQYVIFDEHFYVGLKQ